MKEYCTYIRVSTQKQGRTGLGLEAQREMCASFISQQSGTMVQEFVDVESGTHRNRKGLQQAIQYCTQNKCGLVIAKLDRLARDVEFCFKVVNTGIDIYFCDFPTMNTLLLGVFASVAQYERELTSDRTKKALAVKMKSGAKIGAANEKYKETFAAKSEEEKMAINKRRAVTRNKHNIESRDTQAMFRILRRVFPAATAGEPREWQWWKINTKNGAKNSIYAMMEDFKDMDETGATFTKWSFNDMDERKKQQKLGSYLATIKKAVMYEA